MTNPLTYIEEHQWEKVVSREMSLFDLMCAAQAYLLLPAALDSVVVNRNAMATRYAIPDQMKELEETLKRPDTLARMKKAVEKDKKFLEILRSDLSDDLDAFIKAYVGSWYAELLGFYVGQFADDTEAHEAASSIRGTGSAQHEASVHRVPELLLKFAGSTGISTDLASFVMPAEIISGRIDIEELKSRQELCILSAIQGTIVLSIGDEARKIEKLVTLDISHNLSMDSVRSISGQIGNKGLAKGRVKIVNGLSDAEKVEEGDILVSIMTRTNLIHAMNKAAAFVTDEGGITCHAAIIARELKKPCIIGTKIATQVLRDGDLVEVDAEKGIVRILEKKI